MKELAISFIDNCYKDAIQLKEEFKKTESKEWDVNTVLLELGVQLGHVFNIKCHDDNLNEKMRNINNFGDEISDVLLQTMYLGYLEKVNFKKEINFKYSEIDGIIVLYGQLVEAIMEENSYRFKKQRVGFETRMDFIRDRILKIYILIINYANENNIDIIAEFKKMENDAKGFLKKYEKEHRM